MSSILHTARFRIGLSQEQAAKKLGIHTTTLNKYENGHRTPSGKVMQKMATLYGVPIGQLFGQQLPAGQQLTTEEEMYRAKFEKAQAKIIELLDRNLELERELAKKRLEASNR
jgi:transcriptional regulator with XRE-family HTH domain